MAKHLFIDLECTVIEPLYQGFSNYDLLYANVRKIKHELDKGYDTLNIFSFAIQTETDLRDFNKFLRPELEERLTHLTVIPALVDFGNNPSILKAASRMRGVHVTPHELFRYWNKDRAFEDFVKYYAKPSTESVLIDDAIGTFQEGNNGMQYWKMYGI